jgi:hypothetical protein
MAVSIDEKLPRLVKTTGLYGTPRTPDQIQGDYGRMTDADAATGAVEQAALGYQSRLNQIPGPSPAQLAASNPPSPATTRPGPISQMAAPARPAPQAPAPKPLAAPDPMSGMQVTNTGVSGVKRIDGGSSPLFTNLDPGKAVQEMGGMQSGAQSGGTVNSMPAASFMTAGPIASRALAAAQRAAAERGEAWSGEGPQVGMIGSPSGSDRPGATLEKWAREGLIKGTGRTAQTLRANMAMADDKNALGYAGLAAQEQNNAARLGLDTQRLGLDTQRLAQDQAAGLAGLSGKEAATQGQTIQNEQNQMQLDLTRKAVAGDKEALAKLQALSGKEPKNQRLSLLSTLAEAYTKSAASSLGTPIPFDQILQQIMPALDQASGVTGKGAAPAPAAPPPDGTRGSFNGKTGVVRNGQFIPD